VCEDNYKEEEKKNIDKTTINKKTKKRFKEIAIQVHELMP